MMSILVEVFLFFQARSSHQVFTILGVWFASGADRFFICQFNILAQKVAPSIDKNRSTEVKLWIGFLGVQVISAHTKG